MKLLLILSVTLLATCAAVNPSPTDTRSRNMITGDINGDDLVNCIDRALFFYDMCKDAGLTVRLIYAKNTYKLPGEAVTAHLWVNVNGVDVEPFAEKQDVYSVCLFDTAEIDVTRHYTAIRNNTFVWKDVYK